MQTYLRTFIISCRKHTCTRRFTISFIESNHDQIRRSPCCHRRCPQWNSQWFLPKWVWWLMYWRISVLSGQRKLNVIRFWLMMMLYFIFDYYFLQSLLATFCDVQNQREKLTSRMLLPRHLQPQPLQPVPWLLLMYRLWIWWVVHPLVVHQPWFPKKWSEKVSTEHMKLISLRLMTRLNLPSKVQRKPSLKKVCLPTVTITTRWINESVHIEALSGQKQNS